MVRAGMWGPQLCGRGLGGGLCRTVWNRGAAGDAAILRRCLSPAFILVLLVHSGDALVQTSQSQGRRRADALKPSSRIENNLSWDRSQTRFGMFARAVITIIAFATCASGAY